MLSPALGGIVIGQEIARVMKTFSENNIRAIFTERDDNGNMTLRRGFQIYSEDNILIVEDVVTTGKSTREVINVVLENKGNLVAISSIFNRSSEELNFDVPYYYIAKVNVNNFIPEECPLCKQNLPLVKPGSRKNK